MNDTEPKVLLLDSDIEAIPPLYRRLTDSGCRVATYSSPPAACAYAAEERPDLILTSIDFPRFRGLELVRRLRKESPQSWILVLTASKPWLRLDDVVAAGADALLAGAPSPENVLRLVDEFLGGRLVRIND